MAQRENPAAENLTKKRFSFFLAIFLAAGIPILFERVPKIFKVYCVAVNICLYTVYVCIFLELFMQRDDLEHTMETVRMAAPASTIIAEHIFARYIPFIQPSSRHC
jgi:hypothetical protein